MIVTWKNLHYYVLGAVMLNVIILLALTPKSVNIKGKAPIDGKMGIPTVLVKKNAKEVNPPIVIEDNVMNNTDGEVSVAEDIGKNIAAGPNGIPVPLAGKIDTSQKQSQSIISYLYYTIIFLCLSYSIYLLIHFLNKNNTTNQETLLSSPSYILLDTKQA